MHEGTTPHHSPYLRCEAANKHGAAFERLPLGGRQAGVDRGQRERLALM